MPEFPGPLYERCEDPACPYDYAYRFDGTKAPHYHYVGPRREEDETVDDA